MERISHTDFIVRNQPWLLARSLRAVIRQDPAVVECTAHKLVSDGTTWQLHIDAVDPVHCLLNATKNIKVGLLTAPGLDGKTHNALPGV